MTMRKFASDILKNYCSWTMQQRVEIHPDFKSSDTTLKIENNPLRLLEVIKELIHDQVRAQYPVASGRNAFHRFTTMKQEDNESLIDYHKRFKQQRDIVKTQMGTNLFDQWTTRSKAYRDETDATKKQAMIDQSFDQACAYRCMDGADRTKYGSFMQQLKSQYGLRNDQYPKTLTQALDALSVHPWDHAYKERQEQRQDEEQKPSANTDKDQEPTPGTNLAQTKYHIICYACGEEEHTTDDCTKKDDISKNKWWIRKNPNHGKPEHNTEKNKTDKPPDRNRRSAYHNSDSQDMDTNEENEPTATRSWTGFA